MRKPITAESLAKSRPHTHKPASVVGNLEHCECGCVRAFIITQGRREPGSWT